jgi:competence protein ComEC
VIFVHSAPLHPLIFVAAWLAGNAWHLHQPQLGSRVTIATAVVVAAACLAVAVACRARSIAASPPSGVVPVLVIVAASATLAGAVGEWRAHDRLDGRLDPSLEGVDLDVTGVVATLPRMSSDGVHVVFDIASARRAGAGRAAAGLDAGLRVPARVALGWYRDGEFDASELPRVAAGERWQLTVRLRRPHGLMNPHGSDVELWLFERGIAATGSVRPGGDNRRLGIDRSRVVERARQSVRDAIERRVADPRASGLLAALAVGDQSAIDGDDWSLYRDTGVAHLMSISGLHVTMFAWLAAGVVGALWRRSLRACLWCPAPTAARAGGVVLASGYAVLAGWGVPAQRTVWMLAAVVALQMLGRRWPWPWVLGGAAFAVVLVDPWAWLQPGFWLSFVAVGLLMLGGDRPRDEGAVAPSAGTTPRPSRVTTTLARGWRGWHAVRQGLRTQVIATVGLAPLSLVFFQQVSLVGFAANLVAIPAVTLVITPLALLGIAAPPLWSAAAFVIDGLHGVLTSLGHAPAATWTAAVAPWWAQLAGLAAGVLAVAPLPWRARAFAVPMALPLLLPVVDRPQEGRFEVVAVDVGQGSAVLVRTRTKLMLFDTGPAYARERDAGERVLLPLLRARGETRIDHLVLSHEDNDHVGGAPALIDALPVGALWSSLPDDHRLRQRGLAHRPCEAGASWQWDGVRFEVLHPFADDRSAAAVQRGKTNARSCVVRVVDARGDALLLTGDIEAAQEQALLASGATLRSRVLIVAHHGSRTSTTAAWLDAVQPTYAVVQAGYRNRFGHPAPTVEQRLVEHGAQVVRNDRCGAWSWRGGDDATCERVARRRYWHDDRHGALATASAAALPTR